MEFSDLALAKLLQTVPELGSMIANFQDVSDELPEDSTIQVGVFVLQSGSQVFYIPVVAKNGNVYPIDSVYLDDKKKFFPLTRKTVSMITTSSQTEQGKATRIPNTVIGNPSVYELINPPRTGKYVYASASRLTDFLSQLPDTVKKATFEKIAAEKSVYDNLDQLFGLKAIFDVLKPVNQSLAAKTNNVPVSVVTDANPTLSDAEIQSILQDGYAIQGQPKATRVAVSVMDMNKDGRFREVTSLDGDRDFTFVMETGLTREAFVPKMHSYNPSGDSLALFTNGDFAQKRSFVVVGEELDRRDTLKTLFEYNPPVLLRHCEQGDTIVLSLNDGTFLGPFRVSRVALTSYGVDMRVFSYGASRNIERIQGFRNFTKNAELEGATLFVPSNTVVLKLRNNVTDETEDHLTCAVNKREMVVMQNLGAELNLGFDGVEYTMNGAPVGQEPKVMEILVVREGIDPQVARNFVKEAQLTKRVKIFMSKQAESTDYSPSEVPTYGILPESNWDVAPNGAFMPNLQQSMELGDSQVTEATIISELLQVPDMYELIGEYLPEIEEAIDKLGRILFASRVHLDQLAGNGDAEGLFAFLATLKSVYRLMGDNFLKLQGMVASSVAAGDTQNKMEQQQAA